MNPLKQKGAIMGAKREKVILIRVTEEEHAQLTARKDRTRLAEWMREYCLSAGVISKPESTVLEKTIPPVIAKEFSKIGSNMNQIAKAMNIAVRSANDLELKEIAERACFHLEETESHLFDIRNILLTN